MIAHALSGEQTNRLDRLKSQWNLIRGDTRREATREELIDYLLQREEDEIRAMREAGDHEPIAYIVVQPGDPEPNLPAINDELVSSYARSLDAVHAGLRGLEGIGV